MISLVVLGCSGGKDDGGPPPPPPEDTGRTGDTGPNFSLVPCDDDPPPHATSVLEDVLVREGDPIPRCSFACDAGYGRDGFGCSSLGLCVQGWCFENPFPSSLAVDSVVMTGANDVIVASSAIPGVVLHRDGDFLRPEPLPDPLAEPRHLFARAADDVWLATSSGVFWWDGSSWIEDTLGPDAPYDRVWASSGEVWAVRHALAGDDYERKIGPFWELVLDGTEQVVDLVGTGTHDLSVVTTDNLLAFDGTGFLPVALPAAATAPTSVAKQGGDVLVGDASGQVFTFDGSVFVVDPTSAPVSDLAVFDITTYAATAPLDQSAGGGFSVQSVGQAFDASAVATGPAGEVAVGGTRGELVVSTGGAFDSVSSGVRSDLRAAASVGGARWFAGDDGVVLFQAASGEPWVERPISIGADVLDLHAAGSTDVFALAGDQVWRWVGNTWVSTTLEATVTPRAMSGAGSSLLVAGDGFVASYDGAAWSTPTSPAAPWSAVWLASPGDGWLFADDGSIGRWDGATVAVVQDLDLPFVDADGVASVGIAVASSGEVATLTTGTWAVSHTFFGGAAVFVEVFAVDDALVGVFGGQQRWDGASYSLVGAPIAATTALLDGSELLLGGPGGAILRPE